MEQEIAELKSFLDSSHSSYHAVAALCRMLENTGYTCLQETEDWQLIPGGKYYMTRGGSGLLAFRVPCGEPMGFMMSGTHCDRPCFQVKENGELSGAYTRLATEKYGGMILSSWMDRPLSVAGRVMVENQGEIHSRLLDVDEDLLLIPSVAIHMNRKVNEGYTWNPAVDTLPLVGSKQSQGSLWQRLENEAGGKILGHDLYLYIRQKATVWGVNREYISSAALDDLACVWACAQGFLKANGTNAIPMLCVFDSEEVGSCSAQGAASTLLENAIERICRTLKLDLHRLLGNSFMISADNAHALHPNHPELADATNAPLLGEGIVLKFNANQRYTTNGMSGAVLRKICQDAHVPVQTYYNRADLPGGSTLGNISLGHVSVPTADIGLPQLAMHASFETGAVADVKSLVTLIAAFYASQLEILSDRGFRLV